MINIFIFVKDEKKLKKLHMSVNKYFHDIKHPVNINSTFNCDMANKYIAANIKKADISFVDFSEESEGFALAGKLRSMSIHTAWIFVSNTVDCLLNTLALRPSGYLADFDDMQELYNVLGRLTNEHIVKTKNSFYTFKCEGEYIKVPYKNISFFESCAKKVTLNIANNQKKYDFTAKLDEILNGLPSVFLKCHQSYIVNMEHIKIFDTKNQTFTLFSGENIFISRRMFHDTRKKYEEFLARRQ